MHQTLSLQSIVIYTLAIDLMLSERAGIYWNILFFTLFRYQSIGLNA